MPKQYTQKQIDAVRQTLPEELHEAMVSMETAQHIWDIKAKYGVVDERGNEIPTYVGYVLMGLMLPTEFVAVLKEELKLPKKTAEDMAHDINRFIFYPVKPALEQLHSMDIGARAKEKEEEEPGEQPEAKEPEQKPEGDDRYRESLE